MQNIVIRNLTVRHCRLKGEKKKSENNQKLLRYITDKKHEKKYFLSYLSFKSSSILCVEMIKIAHVFHN